MPKNLLPNPSKAGKFNSSGLSLFIIGFVLAFLAAYFYFSYSVLGINPFATQQYTQVDMLPTTRLDGGVQPRSYAEVLAFLKEDQTNEVQYGVGQFDCKEYALFTWIHALTAGIDCYPVIVMRDAPTSHMIVAFRTTDRHMIFIEPQADQEVFPATWKKWGGAKILGLYYLEANMTPVMSSYPAFESLVSPATE